MSSLAIIYYAFYNNPFLRYNDNKYRLKNVGKDYFQFICTNKECKTKIWTNLINRGSTEFYIRRIDGVCDHSKTLNNEQWNKLWAINEICMMTQTYPKHEAYDNWCLSNPQICTLFYDFYEVKNKLYRFNQSNPHSMPKTKQEFTNLLSNTDYKYNFWGFNKRKQRLDKNYNDLNYKFIFQGNIFSDNKFIAMNDSIGSNDNYVFFCCMLLIQP